MCSRKFILVLISIFLSFGVAAAAPEKKDDEEKKTPVEEMTGKEIYEEVGKRHARPVEFEIQKITLTDDKGNEEVRDVKRYARTVAPGEHRYLVVFHSPQSIRGTATITWKRRFKNDGQWMYLPANGGKPIRIVKGGKKNYFMGTDFTGEDLTSEPSDKLEFERQKNETLDGKEYLVIDITPKDAELKAETGYKRRRLWIDKKNFVVMRTDYYDWRDTLIKRQTASDVKRIEDDTWRADTQTMENFDVGHKTRIDVIERDFEESSVPMELFFERTLISGDHVR